MLAFVLTISDPKPNGRAVKKVPPSRSVRARCRTRALRRAASQGGGSALANPGAADQRAIDLAHFARVERLTARGARSMSYPGFPQAIAPLRHPRSEIAPQRLEKIESRLGNGMGSDASNLQYLVHDRAADRCSSGVYDAKFSASQPLEIAENREGISKTSSPPS